MKRNETDRASKEIRVENGERFAHRVDPALRLHSQNQYNLCITSHHPLKHSFTHSLPLFPVLFLLLLLFLQRDANHHHIQQALRYTQYQSHL